MPLSAQSVFCFSGIEEAESRALDNLGRTKARMGKYEDAIKL